MLIAGGLRIGGFDHSPDRVVVRLGFLGHWGMRRGRVGDARGGGLGRPDRHLQRRGAGRALMGDATRRFSTMARHLRSHGGGQVRAVHYSCITVQQSIYGFRTDRNHGGPARVRYAKLGLSSSSRRTITVAKSGHASMRPWFCRDLDADKSPIDAPVAAGLCLGSRERVVSCCGRSIL